MAEMTTSDSAMVTVPGDAQILIIREFNAPRHLVYRAYTTPELIRRWWPGHRGRCISAEVHWPRCPAHHRLISSGMV